MFLELSPTCPLSFSSVRLQERGEEPELNVQPVFVRTALAKYKQPGRLWPWSWSFGCSSIFMAVCIFCRLF